MKGSSAIDVTPALRAAAEALTRAIDAYVAEAVKGALAPSDVYSSQHLPPDIPSRRRFHEICRTVPGARKQGRAWTVSRDAWEKARAASQPDAAVDAIIAGAGFRPTRRVS
jgi:hypothetical protein